MKGWTVHIGDDESFEIIQVEDAPIGSDAWLNGIFETKLEALENHLYSALLHRERVSAGIKAARSMIRRERARKKVGP